MTDPVPRGTLFQNASFVHDDLRGSTLERLLAFTDDTGEPIVLFLKCAGHHWQRCFIDAGLNFWSEISEEAAMDELHEEPHVDLGHRLGVIGQSVGTVAADDTARIRIALSSGEIVLTARA